MHTRKKYRNNLQEFERLIHHRHNGLRKKRDKVWSCESVGKLKGVGRLAKVKINELSIHTIADLQLHVHHHGIPKVNIRGFNQIYDISIQALLGNLPSPFKDHRKAKIRIFKDMERYG